MRHYVGPIWPLDIAAYEYVLDLAPSDVAWEFLRRNPDYQRDYRVALRGRQRPRRLKTGQHLTRLRRHPTRCGHWGVHPFVDPKLPAPDAPVCWTGHGRSLDAVATRAGDGPSADLGIVGHIAAKHVILGPTGQEFVLLRDAIHSVTLHLQGARASLGNVELTFTIPGLPDPDCIAQRFRALTKLLQCPRARADRSRSRLFLRDALVALDAFQLGASYRETAAVIYGQGRVRSAWASPSTAMKERMRHILKRAHTLRDGGYRTLLE
ncbi:MAG: DUF2285 domain-containing protein [Hyphomonadaceae bacterium]|nr:DUF2285 domain-containing protein [Hyphomonadaceae bacterium]